MGECERLIDIERELANRINECELVSDLRLTYEEFYALETKYGEIMGNLKESKVLANSIKYFGVTTTCILVYEALYRYRKNFWDNIIKLLNIENKDVNIIKEACISTFNYTIKKYELKEFKNVGGYKNITPIICHSGVPNSSLNILFTITTEFTGIKDIGPEEVIENIKYFMRYKVDKSIYRFIINNEERAKEFIYDLQVLVKETDENDYSEYDLEEKFNNLEKRILREYKKYRESKEYLNAKSNRKKNYIIQPKIILDNITKGLILVLPSNTVKNSFVDILEWHIITEDSVKIIECNLYEKNGECISESKKIKLLPKSNYKIKLIYEDEVLNEWQFSGFEKDSPFMIFDIKGGLLKSTSIREEEIYIIMKNNCKIIAENIAKREFDIDEKGYLECVGQEVKFKEKIQQIEIVTEDDIFKIKYINRNNIILQGERRVFSSEYIEEGIEIYSEIAPNIKIDTGIMIGGSSYIAIKNIKNNVNLKIPIEESKDNEERIVSLNEIDCFKEKIYGEYDVRVYEGSKFIKVLPFKFIPKIEVNNSYVSEYPLEKGRYKNQTISITCDKSITMNLENTNYNVEEGNVYKKYIFNYYGVEHFMNGNLEIQINNQYFKFNIKSKTRSICYSLLNEEEGIENIKFLNKPAVIYTKELQTNNKLLVVSFMGRNIENFKVEVFLNDYKGKMLQWSKKECINNKYMFIPLNKFYDTINTSCETKFIIKLIIKDSYGKVISEFIPCVIKEEVLISKVKYKELANGNIELSWISEGIKMENEVALKIYDVFKPWKEPLSLEIDENNIVKEGKKITAYLKKDKLKLKKDEKYYFNIENEQDDLFVENKFGKILIFNREGLYNRDCDYKLEKVTELKVLISNLIKARKKSELEEVFSDIKKYKITEELSIELLNSIFFIYINRLNLCDTSVEDRKLKSRCIYGLCFKYIQRYNFYTIVEKFLELDSYENIKNLLDKLKIVNMDIDTDNGIDKIKREILWEKDKERAFLIETRSGISSKSILIKNVCDLIGEELEKKVLKYSLECNECRYKGNKGCISMYIKRRCNKRTVNLSEELIGSKEMYSSLFEKYNTRCKRKDLESLNWIDSTGDNGIVINGKTYVETLFEWVEYYNNDKRKDLYYKISDEIIELNEMIKKLNYNYEFNIFNKMLLKRKENNKTGPNTLAYYCGVTTLIVSMIKYRKLNDLLRNKEKQGIIKLMMIFREEMREMYLRDLYIIEFYLIQGEKLYVDRTN